MKQHIVSVGGGIASTLLLPLYVVGTYGKQNTRLIMARLPNEDSDVWRLVNAVEGITGINVEMIGDGRTPIDVFFDVRFLGNTRVDPCSDRLKRRVVRDYIKSNCDPDDTVLHVGIGAHEMDRHLNIKKRWGGFGL